MSEHEEGPAPWVGGARLGLGLVWGVTLWLLHESTEAKVWPATEPMLFAPLLLALAFTPFLILASLGELKLRTLLIWSGAAAAVLAALAVYDICRDDGVTEPGGPRVFLSPPLLICGAAALFIAHHLFVPAARERRLIAAYPAYFDTASKHAVQLALSGLFTGAFWILLTLGAALFKLIGLTFLEDLIRQDWFHVPASATMFAAAVHLTDVNVRLIRGVRSVALTLLSWLLPVMAVIGVGFLLALPFTGLEPLWETKAAAGILLAAAAALIVLINAAYQDGDEEGRTPAVLKWAVRITAVALVPLTAIAAYALALRIGQHGLTPERIIAAALVLIGVVLALGYAASALLPGRWMARLEPTNLACGFLAVAVFLALFSPLADPARLSVADQVGRLERGAVKPEAFDYAFLRFDGADGGREALKRLAEHRDPEIARRASEALAAENRWEATRPKIEPRRMREAKLTVHPQGARLPDSFLDQPWGADDTPPPCLTEGACDVFQLNLDAEPAPEVVLHDGGSVAVYTAEGGVWKRLGWAPLHGCPEVLDSLKAGRARAAEPALRDLDVGGRKVRLQPFEQRLGCESESAR
ncbi:MAG TPA: DUF4153 domain-containing protein [Caulobacteraceae bacterium]|nr:DUF4153 domain-containing protein [Caulobacteraceae bacterium]